MLTVKVADTRQLAFRIRQVSFPPWMGEGKFALEILEGARRNIFCNIRIQRPFHTSIFKSPVPNTKEQKQ